MTEPTTPDRVIDHNNECVGCGAHFSEPCHPSCPFETGHFGPAVLLRAAAGQLTQHPAGVGYNISATLFATAVELVRGSAAGAASDEATAALADFLVASSGGKAEAIRDQVVYRLTADVVPGEQVGAGGRHGGGRLGVVDQKHEGGAVGVPSAHRFEPGWPVGQHRRRPRGGEDPSDQPVQARVVQPGAGVPGATVAGHRRRPGHRTVHIGLQYLGRRRSAEFPPDLADAAAGQLHRRPGR